MCLMMSLIYLRVPTLWVIRRKWGPQQRNLPCGPNTSNSALGRQVYRGPVLLKTTHPSSPASFLPFSPLTGRGNWDFFFLKGRKNIQTIKSQHQLKSNAALEACGTGCFMHLEVAVVAVGDVGWWSQECNWLLSGGRWGSNNLPPALQTSHPRPRAV